MRPINYLILLMAVVTASCTKSATTPTATTSGTARLTEIKITNGTNVETRQFQYNTTGKLSKYISTIFSNNVKTLEGVTTYTYNANNMPIKEVTVYTTNGATKTVPADYTYNNGLLQKVKYTDPDNNVKEWTYAYEGGKVVKVTNTWENSAVWNDLFITYNSGTGDVNKLIEKFSEDPTSERVFATNVVYDGHLNYLNMIPGLVNSQGVFGTGVQAFSLHNVKEYENSRGKVVNTIVYNINGLPKRITNSQNNTVYEFTY